MGPKKADNTGKGNKLSQGNISNAVGGGTAGEQEYQQCTGKFAADLELCCREASPAYPVIIPVHIRGHPVQSAQIQSLPPQSQQQQRSRTHSRASATPSAMGGSGEEQVSTVGKKTTRTRKASNNQSGIVIEVTGIDNDSGSFTITGQEPSKTSSSLYKTSTSSSLYKTFHLLNDGDYFRPKLVVDTANNETESIDQITVLYMKDWQLDQRFIDILKKVLPLQEQLHTLNFCFVGLNEQTIKGLVELCQVTKNLKTLSLDGNPLAAEYFHLLIEKEDSKIIHLSLRFCNITDTGAERLANTLGNMSTQNWKLLTLNLSGNRIADDGAISFATALRYNRTLISLNLSSNFITDKGAFLLALVLRRIVLTSEEILRRRYLIAQRYAETHPDDFRNNASSPTPSNLSTKSKLGRTDWKRLQDPNKRKLNSSKLAQIVVDKRNRPESTNDSRPSSRNKGDTKQSQNERSASRSTTLNPPSATSTTSRRTSANTANTTNKEPDQPRTTGTARVKKIATVVSATSKKNISIVKEEDEDTFGEGRPSDLSSSGKLIALQIQHIDRENPLFGTNEAESHDGEIWLKGNYVLLNLNLSRNYLTLDSVKEFLLSIQQQSALTQFHDAFNLSLTTTTSLMNFSGLCRLELKGMNEISTKSSEYQSLETLLSQKSPLIRFQQFRERETKELLDPQSIQPLQQLPSSLPEKATNIPEKTRGGSSMKTTAQRPTSRLKE